MDWKDLAGLVGKAAPLLGTLIGGPAAPIVGSMIAAAFGADNTPDAIHAAVLANPEAAVKLAQIQADNSVQLQQLAVQAEANRLAADTARMQAEIEDRKDARARNAGNAAVWWIACLVLLTFAGIMGAVLVGCWMLLAGGMPIKDVAVVAAISGLIGSVVGYVAANAQTVINFIFGGSLGSEKKTDALAASVGQAIRAAGVRGG